MVFAFSDGTGLCVGILVLASDYSDTSDIYCAEPRFYEV